jgi:hypothetical protein
MINYRASRDTITRAILKTLCPDRVVDDEICHQHFISWWHNIRSDGGLRLTDVGKQAFEQASIEYYDYKVDRSPSFATWYNMYLIQLDKHIPCPYYFNFSTKEVRLYDSRVAMLVGLYGGITPYLNSISNNKELS